MEIVFGENNLNSVPSSGAFDNLLGTVAGNQFFDKEALKNIQTEQLEEAFLDWAENDFLGNADDDDENRSILGEVTASMEEYREDWESFNTAENTRAGLQKQIEALENRKAYEMSLTEASYNAKQITALKAQLSQIVE